MAAFPRFPDTLCHWWPHQPGALCRAALFAAIIDDPAQPDAPEALVQAIDALTIPQEADSAWQTLSPGEQRRQKALRFIEQLAQPESLSDERLLTTARALVRAAAGDHPPPVYDPFAGSGSIPFEAQRLGLEAYASDLNPVAVLLNRALIDLPARFAGLPPDGSVEAAQRFFVERFRTVCECLKEAHDPAYPLILFSPSDRGADADPASDETGASDGQHASVSVDLSP